MTLPRELFAEVNSCQYLFLREIAEPVENRLRVVVEEASAQPEVVPIEIAGTIIEGGHPVRSNETSRTFEILWDSYVAYSVIDESFATPDNTEKSDIGPHCQVYSESRFVEYVSRATWANREHPGPFNHVRIACENHVVDVVSVGAPRVRLLRLGGNPSAWKVQ